MQVPTTPEDVAAAMDPWEASNGRNDLYDELVAHLGKTAADDLWSRACAAYDALRAAA